MDDVRAMLFVAAILPAEVRPCEILYERIAGLFQRRKDAETLGFMVNRSIMIHDWRCISCCCDVNLSLIDRMTRQRSSDVSCRYDDLHNKMISRTHGFLTLSAQVRKNQPSYEAAAKNPTQKNANMEVHTPNLPT